MFRRRRRSVSAERCWVRRIDGGGVRKNGLCRFGV